MATKNGMTSVSFNDLAEFLADSVKDSPTMQIPAPELVNYYRDLANRILWIDDEIDQSTMSIVKRIMEFNLADKDIPVEERKPIKILLDTTGGSVSVMWSIIRAIKMSKTPVYTVNFCDCLSAGAHILASGHKRFAMPGSTVLIHSGSCMYTGTQEQADNAKKYYDALCKKADAQLLADTKIDLKIFKKKSPFDWYLDADEAVQYGIVDKIIEDFTELD